MSLRKSKNERTQNVYMARLLSRTSPSDNHLLYFTPANVDHAAPTTAPAQYVSWLHEPVPTTHG